MIGTQPVSQHWLECQLDKGMFSDEVAVTYPRDGPMMRSVFVPSSAVSGQAGGKGKVRIVVRWKKGENVLAVLPSPEQDVVMVSEKYVSNSP